MCHVHTGREDSKCNTGQNRTGSCHGHVTGCAPVDKEEAGSPCRRRRVCSASRVQGQPRKGPTTWTLTMASWCLRGRRKGKLPLQTWGGGCKPPGRMKLKGQLTLRKQERGDALRPPQRKDRDGSTRSFENTLKSTGGTGPDTARSLIHASA